MKLYKIQNSLGVDCDLYSMSVGWVKIKDRNYSLLFTPPGLFSDCEVIEQKNKRPVFLRHVKDINADKLPNANIFSQMPKDIYFCYPSTQKPQFIPSRKLIIAAEKIRDEEDSLCL